jgi:hypothetical protein
MQRPVFNFAGLLLALPLLCAARQPESPDAGYFDKSLRAMGGYFRYERIETVAYDFVETVPGKTEPRRGRHFFKMHDGKGLRGREDVVAAAGRTLTIFDSTRVWRSEEGTLVEDAERRTRAAEDLRRHVFWLFLPHTLRESSAPVRYVGLGHFHSRLSRRLEIPSASVPVPLGGDVFTVYVDTGNYRIDGVAYISSAGESQQIVFESYLPTTSLTVPARWLRHGADDSPAGELQIYNLSLNSYLDDALFEPDGQASPAGSDGSFPHPTKEISTP